MVRDAYRAVRKLSLRAGPSRTWLMEGTRFDGKSEEDLRQWLTVHSKGKIDLSRWGQGTVCMYEEGILCLMAH